MVDPSPPIPSIPTPSTMLHQLFYRHMQLIIVNDICVLTQCITSLSNPNTSLIPMLNIPPLMQYRMPSIQFLCTGTQTILNYIDYFA